MSIEEKALKLSKKAYKLSCKALKSDSNEFIVLVGYDDLWKNPNCNTMLFCVVAHSGKTASIHTPVHLDTASYSDLVNDNAFMGGSFHLTHTQADKYAHKLNESRINKAIVMSVGDFADKYRFLME